MLTSNVDLGALAEKVREDLVGANNGTEDATEHTRLGAGGNDLLLLVAAVDLVAGAAGGLGLADSHAVALGDDGFLRSGGHNGDESSEGSSEAHVGGCFVGKRREYLEVSWS